MAKCRYIDTKKSHIGYAGLSKYLNYCKSYLLLNSPETLVARKVPRVPVD